MSRSSTSRCTRTVLAVLLVVVAIGLIVTEPFPKGAVLVSVTATHGIDAGDLPAVVLLLIAAWVAI
jgi:hypothetical protein